jgi:hypothetical protein
MFGDRTVSPRQAEQRMPSVENDAMAIEIRPPFVVVPVVIAAIACGLLVYIGGPVYGQQDIAAQIERDDSALCNKFGFARGTPRAGECVADLAELRRRHERLIAPY